MGGEQHRQKPETEEEEGEEADERREQAAGVGCQRCSTQEMKVYMRVVTPAVPRVSLIIPCYLVNAICPTLLSFLEVWRPKLLRVLFCIFLIKISSSAVFMYCLSPCSRRLFMVTPRTHGYTLCTAGWVYLFTCI